MPIREPRVAAVCVAIALAAIAGCAKEQLPPRTPLELMDDPVVLQAVLARCNESGDLRDPECSNAREAVERLEGEQSVELRKQKQAAAQSEFERARAARREREALERRRQEAEQKVDPYTMPLVKDPMSPAPQTAVLNPSTNPSAS